jgi:hypothetical protein
LARHDPAVGLETLAYRYVGHEMRLTDVDGKVVKDIIA